MKKLLKIVSLCLVLVIIPSVWVFSTDGSDLTLNTEENSFTRDWGNLGLYGGQIYDIEIDATNAARIFAGAYYGDGLFLSTDGGDTWVPVLTGHEADEWNGEATFRNTAVWAVKIAPGYSNRVWAVHNYWAEYSLDGGGSWNHVLNSQMQATCTHCGGESDQWRFCQSLAIDPSNPQRVYVGTGGPFGTFADGAVYRTDDGGDTWTKTGLAGTYEFSDTVVDIAVNPTAPGTVWAITSGGRLYRTTDYGSNWSLILSGGFTFYDLELWPANPNVVFIATIFGIYRYYAGSAPTIYSGYVRALAFDPQNPNVLFAAAAGNGVVRGVYNPSTGQFVFGQRSDLGLELITLAVDPTDGQVIFGGELKNGIYQLSYDNIGDSFAANEKNNGVNAIAAYDIDVIAAGDYTPAYLVAATGAGVSYRIGDGAWTRLSTAGLPNAMTFSAAFDPTHSDGTAFYVGGEGFLAKTYNRGSSWSMVNTADIPWNMRVNDIAVDTNGSTLYISTRQIGGSAGRVYKSTNSGADLAQKLSSSSFDFNSVVIDPSDSNHILAGGGNFFAPEVNGLLYQSFNGGNNWSPTGLTDVIVNAIMIDPDDPAVIYAGCGWSGGTPVPLYKSTDGGSTWQPSYAGIPGRPTHDDVWGSAADDVFVLGHTGSIVKGGYDDMNLLHFDGSSWSTDMVSNVLDRLRSIWGQAPDDIFAVGDRGVIVHYDGSEWAAMEGDQDRTTTRNLNAVWGHGPSSVYAVGDLGTILHYGSGVWSAMSSPSGAHLYGVWGHADGSRVYAVGATGTILRYEGSWSTMDSGVKAKLSGIWGPSDGSTIFAVGDPAADPLGDVRYTALRFNGTGWSRLGTPTVESGQGRLRGVWGTSANNVFAVGDDGVILRFNGTSWNRMDSNATEDLLSVWGLASNRVYAVGRNGAVLYYNGSTWAKMNPGQAAIWNAVTDLKSKLDPGGTRNIYAATDRQGVYFSPNQGADWINLLSPPYLVSALEVGSIYVASYGVYAFQGIGFVAGQVRDELTGVGLSQATISTGTGIAAQTNSDGLYVLPLVAGNYDITGDAAGYKPETAYAVPSQKDGNTVNFYLSDPVVYVRINAQEVLATAGTFEGAMGDIVPEEGIYGWSAGNGNGYLQVPYPNGWVRLVISAHAGHQVLDVRVNGSSQGPLSEYVFSNLVHAQTIEALFGPLASLCKADLTQDGDVDGLDVYGFVNGQPNGVSLVDLAAEFGRVDCLP